MRYSRLSTYLILLFCLSCGRKAECQAFNEAFEKGNKDAYARGSLSLGSGRWIFEDALIGSLPADKKRGRSAVRLRNRGSATMDFDLEGEISGLSLLHASYGNDQPAEWQLLYSEDRGNTWKPAGTSERSGQALSVVHFDISHVSGPIRFKLQKLSGGRLNIDDITTDGSSVSAGSNFAAQREDNLALGNPSRAAEDKNNYLLRKPQYDLSYNQSRGTANWVSWHLSSAWKGAEQRCNCFAPDKSLTATITQILPSHYIGSGFDKGHLCPSDDRDGSGTDNAATFLMTNMAPQAPNLNRDVWEKLESYCRKLVAEGNELYIVAGVYGKGGTGEKGFAESIGAGKVVVPAHFWKVIVVLPEGSGDLARIGAHTKVIAVDMPNEQRVNAYTWKHYRTTIDAIEKATGYDLLSRLPEDLQKVLESRLQP